MYLNGAGASEWNTPEDVTYRRQRNVGTRQRTNLDSTTLETPKLLKNIFNLK